MYIEGVKDGKRFYNTLRQATAIKPVVILKGGRGKAGVRATASHTASLTSSMAVWNAMLAQSGAVVARDFDDMADLAISFTLIPEIRGNRVGMCGAGGGISVVGADACEEAGLEVVAFPEELQNDLKKRGIPIWDWIGNPVDTSIMGSDITANEVLQMMAKNENFDLFIAYVYDSPASRAKKETEDRILNETAGYIKVAKSTTKPLLVVVPEKSPDMEFHDNWRLKDLSQARTELSAAGVPFYPSVERAARAASRLVEYYKKRNQ